MFFYERKFSKIERREIQIRDEWGVLRKFDITRGTPELTDKELQAELKSTVVWRRFP